MLIKIHRYLGQLQSPINRGSTAIPTVSIAGGFCRIRHSIYIYNYIYLYNTHRICTENCQSIAYISQYRDMAWARAYSYLYNRGSIADKPRTNRGFHRHFVKNELVGLLDFELCRSDSSLLSAITIYIQHSFQTKPNISLKTAYHSISMHIMQYHIDISSRNNWFSNCSSQSRTNRRSIAMQGFTIADVEICMPFHNF